MSRADRDRLILPPHVKARVDAVERLSATAQFVAGGYYKHVSGIAMHVVAQAPFMRFQAMTLIAETTSETNPVVALPVSGMNPDAYKGWVPISEREWRECWKPCEVETAQVTDGEEDNIELLVEKKVD
jgi:hypothetical protein